MIKNQLLLVVLLAVCFFHTTISSSFGQSRENVEIDVLLTYTQAAKNYEGGTPEIEKKLSQMVTELNTSLSNSANTTRFRLVGIREVSYKEQEGTDSFRELQNNLTTIVQSTSDDVKQIHDLRDSVGADITFVVSKLSKSGCGVTYTLPKNIFTKNNPQDFSKYSFGIYNTSCFTLVFPHEVSHLMGNSHGGSTLEQSVSSEAYAYLFLDTTASPPQRKSTITGGGGKMIPYWSDPNITYNGIKIGESGKSCESCVVNLTKDYISRMRNSIINDDIEWTTTQLELKNGKAALSGRVKIPYSIISTSVDNGQTWKDVTANGTMFTTDISISPSATSFQYKINNGLIKNQSVVVIARDPSPQPPITESKCVSSHHNNTTNILKRGQPITITSQASVPIRLFKFSVYNNDYKNNQGIPYPYCVKGPASIPNQDCPQGSGQLVIEANSNDKPSHSVTIQNSQLTQIDVRTQKIPTNIQVNTTFVTSAGIGINDDGKCVVRFTNELPLRGDLDRNCKVDIYDYNVLLASFNQENCDYNMAGNCRIDGNDTTAFISAYGSSCK